MTSSSSPSANGTIRHGDVGYVSLWVPDVGKARAFYREVLGWPAEGHREVPWAAVPIGMYGGVSEPTLFCNYFVDDVDEAVETVRSIGGRADDPTVEPWGRNAMCADPEGMSFAVFDSSASARAGRPATNGERHGDVAYITVHVGDSAGARAFYGRLLHWDFQPGRVEDGWQLPDVAPMTGMHGGWERPHVAPMYRVDDIGEAIGRVRSAGGTATDPETQPYGISSDCVDDQGMKFWLGAL